MNQQATSNPFFDHPILNSPYATPARHWELDDQGQPTQKIVETRRRADFITPIPKPKKRKIVANQETFLFDEGKGLSTKDQHYDPTSIINEVCNNRETRNENKIRIFVQQSSQIPMLQVVDYVLWTVNRVYEQGDFRHYRFIKEKISLVQDIFDLAKYPKTYYTPEYPLEPNKMSPVGG
jgi:hypothetical protein